MAGSTPQLNIKCRSVVKMKNLKSKLDRLFWKYEETATYFDNINLVCQFAEYIDNMDDLTLAEKLEIDANNPDFDLEVLNARQTVSNGCDKWLAA